MKIIPVIMALAVLAAGCVGQQAPEGQAPAEVDKMQMVNFATEDGWTIFADYYPANGPPVILLHMLGQTKESWGSFPRTLAGSGFAVLAIDMRGHGQSLQSAEGTRTYTTFGREDWLGVLKDISAAKVFLQSRGHSGGFGIAGASIGANLALHYAAGDENVKALALLSPGIDYRGVQTTDVIRSYANALIIIASEDDPQSASASRQLYGASPASAADKQLKIYEYVREGTEHGTHMFAGTDLQQLLVSWFKEKLG